MYKELNEPELASKCREGDSLAADELYRRYAARLLTLCRRYSSSLEDAEDLMHILAEKIPQAQLMQGAEVWIDGFNIVITLEVLLSDSLLFTCMDGTIRDLAALRGTYRLIPETADAVRLILDILQEASVGKVNILLDEPVSNSGRLKSLIAETAGSKYCFDLDIRILRDVDRTLYGKEGVITSDSIILDHCSSWINLTSECLKRKNKQAICVW